MPSCQNRFEDRVINELISKGMPYQLESKRHDTIVHETVIDSSSHALLRRGFGTLVPFIRNVLTCDLV